MRYFLPENKTRKAYSLLEIIVSLAIIGFAMLILFNFLILSLKLSMTSLARSFVREELTTVASLIERDIRNADLVTGCGGSTAQSNCVFVSKGETYSWQFCPSTTNRVCKIRITNGSSDIVFSTSDTVLVKLLTFEKGYTQASPTENFKLNILFTVAADHSRAEFKIQNIVRQQTVSTRNFNIYVSAESVIPSVTPTPTPSPTPVNQLPLGNFEQIRPDGQVVSGWTLDQDIKPNANTVQIFINGPSGTGTLIYNALTPVLRSDINSGYSTSGNHGFEFSIPNQYLDGVAHSIYAYGIDGNDSTKSTLLGGSPKTLNSICKYSPDLNSGKILYPSERICSSDNAYYFANQTDGNLVLYRRSDNAAIWHIGRNGAAGYLIMQTDGNLVLYSTPTGGTVYWNSGTSSAGARLGVNTNAHITIYSLGGAALWTRP